MKIPTENFQNMGVQQAQMLQSPGIAPPPGPQQAPKNIADQTYHESEERLLGSIMGALGRAQKSKKGIFVKEKEQEQDLLQKQQIRELKKIIPQLPTDQLDEKHLGEILKNEEGDFKHGKDEEYSDNKDINSALNRRLQIVQENVLGQGLELIMKEQKARLGILMKDFNDISVEQLAADYQTTGNDNIQNKLQELFQRFNEFKGLGLTRNDQLITQSRKLEGQWLTAKAQIDYLKDPVAFGKMPLDKMLGPTVSATTDDVIVRKGKYQGDYTTASVMTVSELWSNSVDMSHANTKQLLDATLQHMHGSKLEQVWEKPSGIFYQRWQSLPEHEREIYKKKHRSVVNAYKGERNLQNLRAELSPDNESVFHGYTMVKNGQLKPNIATIRADYPENTTAALGVVEQSMKLDENQKMKLHAINHEKVMTALDNNRMKTVEEYLGMAVGARAGVGSLELSERSMIQLTGLKDKLERSDIESTATDSLNNALYPMDISQQGAVEDQFLEAFKKVREDSGQPKQGIDVKSLNPLEKNVYEAPTNVITNHKNRILQDSSAIALRGQTAEVQKSFASLTTSDQVIAQMDLLEQNTTLPSYIKDQILTSQKKRVPILKERETNKDNLKIEEAKQLKALEIEGNISTATDLSNIPSFDEIKNAPINEDQKLVLQTARTLKGYAINLKKSNKEAGDIVSRTLADISKARSEDRATKVIAELIEQVNDHRSVFKDLPERDKSQLMQTLYDRQRQIKEAWETKEKLKNQRDKEVSTEKISRLIRGTNDPAALRDIEQQLRQASPIQVDKGGGVMEAIETGVREPTDKGGLSGIQNEMLISLANLQRKAIEAERKKPQISITDPAHRQFYDEQKRLLQTAQSSDITTKVKTNIKNFRTENNIKEGTVSWLFNLESDALNKQDILKNREVRNKFETYLYRNPGQVLKEGAEAFRKRDKGKKPGRWSRLSHFDGYDWRSVQERAKARLDFLTPDKVEGDELLKGQQNYVGYLYNMAFFSEQNEHWANPLENKNIEGHSLGSRLTGSQKSLFLDIEEYFSLVQDGLGDMADMEDEVSIELLMRDLLDPKLHKNNPAVTKLTDLIKRFGPEQKTKWSSEMSGESRLDKVAHAIMNKKNANAAGNLGWSDTTYEYGHNSDTFQVVDGDTVKVRTPTDKKWRYIRFKGVNTAELGRKDGKGEEAKQALINYITEKGNGRIRIKEFPPGKYGRSTAWAFINTNDLVQSWLIENNYSTIFSYGGLGTKSDELRAAEKIRQQNHGFFEKR